MGRKLAVEGMPEAAIPPCMACHGGGTAPRLAGQHAAYMAGQLRLWKAGYVPQTQGAALMAPVARLLSDDEIEAVSAYFAMSRKSLELPAGPHDQSAKN